MQIQDPDNTYYDHVDNAKAAGVTVRGHVIRIESCAEQLIDPDMSGTVFTDGEKH